MNKADDKSQQAGSPERDAYDWALRFASGKASRAELEDLRRWAARDPANAEAFDRASSAWHTVGLAAPAMEPVPVQVAAPRSTQPSRRLFIGGALAASAAGVLVVRPPLHLWPSWSELAADYRTDVGERKRIELFDRVAIDMNTRTSIAMRSSMPGDEQIELLAGEALVSTPVRPARALTVVAGAGRIVARHASFNVRRDPEVVCVTCLSGEAVVERGGKQLALAAGQQIVYSDRGLGVASTPDTAVVTAWQDGLLVFRAMPIAGVVAEINRYRPGRVILTNAALGRERFSARFRIENIDQVVHQIEEIYRARVTALPGGIVLLG
jgi:transmembrane sensor